MADITSANSVIMLSVADLYNIPIQIQGYSADDIFNTEDVQNAEISMGLDGKLSSGFIYAPVVWNITLQADSASNSIFDAIYGAEKLAVRKFILNGTTALPSTGTIWTMNSGIMTRYKPIADGKKTLQPRRYQITWESVSPSISV